ncbi:hypothetical protein HLRTI_002746 [Halorhabdus tiamatea SARL4B]|uniref:Uncharacterized protein n=1 Tax=Halorhabdus tiamatea SARL4B TaxID=1033806 RepID=U2F9Q9_9EURY|nr:hypothetical protein HLRTI_002746 [Halorhabdus tiamatea SARL4B]
MFVVGAPDTGLLVFLLGVEGAPFRTRIDLVLLDDEPTLRTDGLSAFRVRYQVATTLRTDVGLCLFLGGSLSLIRSLVASEGGI